MLIRRLAAHDKEQIDANDDVEVVSPGCCCRKSRWLSSFLETTFTDKLLHDIVDDVGSCACSTKETNKFFHLWMSQVDMCS